MNKFWQNYFLMNEAGADGSDAGGGSAPVDTGADNGNGDAGGEAGKTVNNDAGFDTGFFNDPEGGEGEKPTEGEKPIEDGEKYDPEQAYTDFKYELPEGYSLTEEQEKYYIDMAKEKGVKPDQLQTFVNENIEVQKKQVEEYRNVVRGWEAEIKADPILGGDNFPTTRKNVNSACSIEGGQEFRKVLGDMGLISNPAVVRYLNNLGTMVNTDGLVTGKQVSNNNASQDIKSLYNKSNY